MAIIGISGKKTSGKDTVGKIIQYLMFKQHFDSKEEFRNETHITYEMAGWTIKKFADPLKDMLCLMIGCTREQLEDEEFKNTELGEEWWYYKINIGIPGKYELIPYQNGKYSQPGLDSFIANQRYLIKPTPRLLLQLLGTEAGRNIIHPNLWVNALFSKYKPLNTISKINTITGKFIGTNIDAYPNWIITDCRFPNELQTIESKGGITIRVERKIIKQSENASYVFNPLMDNQHPSETALDNAEFQYTINNDGSLEELIQKVKKILIKENLIKDV